MTTFVKENSPHLRRKASVTRMMVDVLIALAPTLIFSFVVYPIKTLITYALSLVIMIGSEFVYVGLKNMMPKDGLKHSFKERFTYAYKGHYNQNNILTPAITAVIFTLIMPAGAPIYAIIVGAFVGIVLGKLVFGGLGSNIFNPAAVGMLFAKLCFGSQYVSYVDTWFYKVPDVAAGATPLGLINGGALANFGQYPMLDLFLGRIPGTLGEVYKITILVGLVYLLIRRSIDYRIVVSYLGTFSVLMLCAGLAVFAINKDVNPFSFVLYNLLSGGVLFGAVFMLTDPVTSPINSPSRIMYGMIAAIATVFIRLFAALPEGVGFSILIANMVAVVLDHYEWSNPRYTWKKILAMCLLVVLPALVTFFVIRFGGVYHG
jgi:electron transport complex protein RnfD